MRGNAVKLWDRRSPLAIDDRLIEPANPELVRAFRKSWQLPTFGEAAPLKRPKLEVHEIRLNNCSKRRAR